MAERDTKDPYPSDQSFGAAASEDQERVDKGEKPLHTPEDAPRAGTKAEPEGEDA